MAMRLVVGMVVAWQAAGDLYYMDLRSGDGDTERIAIPGSLFDGHSSAIRKAMGARQVAHAVSEVVPIKGKRGKH